jgi:hypothetical protein
MAPNEITNPKRFLVVPTLENAAAIAAANIRPSQAALFTQTSTGELSTWTDGLCSRFLKAQDLMDLSLKAGDKIVDCH